MWGETIWAISARAELGLGIAGFSSDSSPISLAPCAVAAKKSLQNIRDAIEHERVVLPPYKTVGCLHIKPWDAPILGVGYPWLWVWTLDI